MTPWTRRKVTPSEEAARVELVRSLGVDQPADIAAGIVPVVIAGTDVTRFIDASRPAIGAMRTDFELPKAGETFTRPRETQRGTVAAITPGDPPSSQKVKVTGDTVDKRYYAGSNEWSEQAIDWADPTFAGDTNLGLAEDYAIASEEDACDDLEASITSNVLGAAPDWTNAADVLTSTVAAKTFVRGACKRQANTLFVGADRLDTLESLSGSDGRAVLPELLAATQLQLVYSPGFDADTCIVACSFFLEYYEDIKGFTMLRPKQSNVVAPGADVAGDPTMMGVYVSFSAYAATRIRAEATCGIPAS